MHGLKKAVRSKPERPRLAPARTSRSCREFECLPQVTEVCVIVDTIQRENACAAQEDLAARTSIPNLGCRIDED